jgi:hypothetical protein
VAPELSPLTEATLKVVLDERDRAACGAVRAASLAEWLAARGQGDGKDLNVTKALACCACARPPATLHEATACSARHDRVVAPA